MQHQVLYTVRIFDTDAGQYVTRHGITFAVSYAEAATILDKHYRNALESMNITLMQDEPVLEISDETYNQMNAGNA